MVNFEYLSQSVAYAHILTNQQSVPCVAYLHKKEVTLLEKTIYSFKLFTDQLVEN